MAVAEKKEVPQEEIDFEVEGEEIEFSVEDDTPEADRNRSPMPKEIVEDLENDELESYSDGVKERFKQMKRCGMMNAVLKSLLYVSTNKLLR